MKRITYDLGSLLCLTPGFPDCCDHASQRFILLSERSVLDGELARIALKLLQHHHLAVSTFQSRTSICGPALLAFRLLIANT